MVTLFVQDMVEAIDLLKEITVERNMEENMIPLLEKEEVTMAKMTTRMALSGVVTIAISHLPRDLKEVVEAVVVMEVTGVQ